WSISFTRFTSIRGGVAAVACVGCVVDCICAATAHAAATLPNRQMTTVSSLDHLVGAGEQRGRNLDFERGCGGQVEYEIELGWLLDWQIAWLRATQDLIEILGCASEEVNRAWPIGHETTRSEKVADTVNRWQSCAQCQSVDTGVVGVYERIGAHIKRLRAPLERRKGLCDILGAPDLEHGDIEAERARCRANFS